MRLILQTYSKGIVFTIFIQKFGDIAMERIITEWPETCFLPIDVYTGFTHCTIKDKLKELQSLGLDVRVLRDDNTEVEIMETSDMGETSFRSLIEGDGKYRRDEEDFGKHGYTTQEFQGEELVNEEPEEDEDDYDSDYGDDSFDDYDDMSDDE